jgi:hypothetical protein
MNRRNRRLIVTRRGINRVGRRSACRGGINRSPGRIGHRLRRNVVLRKIASCPATRAAEPLPAKQFRPAVFAVHSPSEEFSPLRITVTTCVVVGQSARTAFRFRAVAIRGTGNLIQTPTTTTINYVNSGLPGG